MYRDMFGSHHWGDCAILLWTEGGYVHKIVPHNKELTCPNIDDAEVWKP
jgi:hypothetical protein